MPARVISPERMDDPALDPRTHRAALTGLARLNRFGAASFVWRAIADLFADATPDRPLRLLDIATGGADVPIALCRRAARAGAPLRVAACDLSPTALDFARQRCDDAGVRIELFALNALHDPLPTGYDVITCSLFTHHLMDHHAVELLSRMAAAAERRIVVSDLHRSAFNHAMIAVGSHLLTMSTVVHADAATSVRAAFTADEARELAARAGLDGAVVEPRFPARWVLTWDKR